MPYYPPSASAAGNPKRTVQISLSAEDASALAAFILANGYNSNKNRPAAATAIISAPAQGRAVRAIYDALTPQPATLADPLLAYRLQIQDDREGAYRLQVQADREGAYRLQMQADHELAMEMQMRG